MSRSVRKQQELAKKASKEAEAEGEEMVEDDAEDEEETVSFIEIDKLQDLGINASDIAKLKAGGLYTVASILMNTKKFLCSIKGISEAKCDKIVEAASKLQFSSFMTGTEYLSKRKDVIRITTGSAQLDALLKGGIETMSITERLSLIGEFRTGKTQLCHTLCVTTQLPRSMNGGNGKVAYIDTEGTFRPDRIGPIAERFGLDPNAALDNIVFARAFTHEHQTELITQIAAKMVEDQYRLLVCCLLFCLSFPWVAYAVFAALQIIDSITALFRVDFSGRGELAERQQKLGRMLSKLMKVAEEFNVAVFITNQVVSDPGGGAMFVADAKKPVGGHVLAHASTTRLYLRKGRGEQRICKIYDSPCLPEAECIYQISDQGIIDAKD
ncbi:Meiotic recombination protein DMC1 B [Balamuthia mandrillaris]